MLLVANRWATPLAFWNTIDLDLSQYDSIATQFAVATEESTSFLKYGIAKQSHTFNRMIDEVERVVLRSKASYDLHMRI